MINEEDGKVATAIAKSLPQIDRLIAEIVERIRGGGRLYYLGAGSGGRLSVLDVIELPTTYGIDKGIFNVVLAGGVERLAEAPEEMEDDPLAGWEELNQRGVSSRDIVIGVSASGTTPFVLGGLSRCRENGIPTGCIVSNPESPIAKQADFPVEIVTGPEFITGSTRMKCGSVQKMVFDMISTTVMVMLGRVRDNRMVNVMLINDKITDRAVKMLMEFAGMDDYDAARRILMEQGSVQRAIEHLSQSQ